MTKPRPAMNLSMPITRLNRASPGFPPELNRLHDPPEGLYLRGTLPSGRAVAVIGTRKMTPYGAHAAEMASRTLARLGVTVVSGLAIGVDGKAHRTALEAGGATVAVLGSGVDDGHIYPRLHFRLARDILSAGHALLSEYPPGTGCRKHHFHARNRLIAGLSEAVLVVEAPKRSGAMMTARLALENGREVWAVPGAITQGNSEGPNRLIRDGAVPVTCPEDIADALGIPYRADEAPVEGDLAKVAAALREGHDSIDALSRAIGRPPDEVSVALTRLELAGRIRTLGGGRFALYTAR